MTESFRNIEDESFPSFLSNSLGSNSSGVLGNVTLCSNLGLPVAASTIAKIRPESDNRVPDIQASYLEDGQFSLPLMESMNAQKGKFALSFKDDLEDADDFIAAHRISDILVKVQQEESTADNIPSKRYGNPGHFLGLISKHMNDISTGLPPTHTKEIKASKPTTTPHPVTIQEERLTNEAPDRDHFGASMSCVLANEKRLSVDGINSNSTDDDEDDIDVDKLLDDGLESYFRQVGPPGMQRGHIEGQELPEAESKLQLSRDGAALQNQQRHGPARENMPVQSSTDQENDRFQFVDHYEEDNFQIPNVRLAATGMDSCPASDEDTEDELEAVHQQNVLRQRCLLPSTTRQLVGESNNTRFRPGLEGGSSDEETCVGVRNASNNSGIAFRRSAEGQVINSPLTGGGGDGTSESDEDNGGLATIPTFSSNVQTTYGDLRGLGIVGCNVADKDDCDQLPLQRVGRNSSPAHREMGDRICPLGTGEVGDTVNRLFPSRSSTNRRLMQDRQDALDAMDNPEVASASGAEDNLDSLYFRNVGENCKPADQSNTGILQRTQNSFHLSQFVPQYGGKDMDGPRGGPCGYSTAPEVLTDSNEEGEEHTNADSQPSLDNKYLSPTPKNEDAGDRWNHHLEQKPDWNVMFDNNGEGITAPQGEDDSHKVIYQNEEGDWVTDLAYYSSFNKEANLLGDATNLFQDEDFISGTNIIEKIAEDEEEFEKEHCFIQEEKIDAQNISLGLGDTSWKLPTSNYVLMRASQAPSDYDRSDQSYLRLSLGQFFGQRSEALGFLGDFEYDIRRPSFGYLITSPEKREPFALIRPSDFSYSNQDQDDTLQFGDEDKTLNPDDLEEQLEENDQLPSATFNIADPELHTAVSVEKGKEFQPDSSSNSSYVTNKTNLPLSISTIASAIADASVSADPAQLAAMIMELSAKNRSKRLAAGVCENSSPLNQEQSEILETLHKTCPAGEVNMFDMEKYLKKTESVGYDSEVETRSVSPYSFDSPDWADSASIPQRHAEPNPPECSERKTLKEENTANKKQSNAHDSTAVPYPVDRNSFNRTNVCDISVPLCHSNGRRPLPKPQASGNPATFSAMETRSVGAGQVKQNQKSFVNASGKFVPVKNKTSLKGSASVVNVSNVEQASGNRGASIRSDTGILHVSSSGPRPATTTHGSLKADKPRTSTDSKTTASRKSASSSLSSPRNQSAVPPSDTQRKDQEKMKSSRNRPTGKAMPVTDAALSGAEKHVSFVETGALPATGKQVDSTKAKVPEQDVQYPEDTQFSFRPSTSPLTHSSPSQVSGMETVKGSSSNSPTSSASSVERHICGSLSPQSDCSSLSLSRLTYVSVYDGTLQNSTIIRSPEKPKNNDTIQLSTTIVRASPTPPVDQDLASGKADAAPSSASPKPKRSNRHQSAESMGARSKSEHNNRTKLTSEIGKQQSEPCLTNQERENYTSSNSSNAMDQPENVNQTWKNGAGETPSLNMFFANRGAGMFTPDDCRYVPISSFKPHGVSNVPCVAPALPTLLTGHSLFTSPIAQQYLGNLPTLHPYGMGAHSGPYGVPVGLPRANLSPGHVQNTVPLGVSATHQVAGFLNAAQFYNAHSSAIDQNLNAGKPYQTHEIEVGGLGGWNGGGIGSGHVVVPEELKFPNACCVGIASQNSLGMFNPTDRWMQVNIAIHSLSINGEKVESLPHQWLIVKNKTIIGPKTTEEQKVLFIPPHPGVYQCVLSVSSWPVSADTEVVAQAEAFAGKVLMMAMAETPSIEVEVGNSGCLEFGDVTSGSVKALPLKLLNRTHATVPIRLVISANATAWRCFTFCKNPVDISAESALQVGRISPLAAPSHISHVMHANYGEEPEEFLVWIHFRAPQKYMSSGDLGPADEYSARINIEVDSPGPSHVITSILLHARSGIARIHAPKHLQTVHLSTLLGTTAKQMLPLKNAGNIDVQLKIKITNSEDCFSVKPEDLFLRAGDEQEIMISFTSQGNRAFRESVLTILVLPTGPQYEVVLKGEICLEKTGEMYLEKTGKSVVSGQSLSSGSSTPTDVPPILSNKQFMAWGGVTLGRAVQQKLVLRNNSLASVQQLRLLIRGQDQDCFQLQSTFGPEERLSSHRELTVRPNEDAAVHLLFTPTRVSCMLAKLEIKQSGMRSTQPGIKFTIPLSGYGGTSNIILEDVKKLSDSYIVTLNGIAPGKVSKVTICMRNTGSRAAYIKAIPFMDLQTEKLMDPKVISISPQQFVLKERTRKVITVLCKSTQRENELCATKMSCLSTICFFCGDEISRQQFRRLLSRKPEAGKQMLPKNSLLKNVIFNERFFEEEQVSEVYDLPQRPNDDQLFYRNMNKVILLVFGNSEMDTSGSDYVDSLQLSPRHSSESDSGLRNPDRHVSNASLDVLPVKGPQGPPLTLSVSDKVLNKSLEPQQTWSIQPEQLILSAPSIDGAADTGHVKILNHSTRGLNFELSWPAHCLTITPQHGIIEPQSHLQILVSPNPSLATKPSLLPWSGQIYIQSDNQQKFIKVQILADIAPEVSATASSTKQLSVLPAQPETPILQMAKPFPKPPSTNVEIKNKTLIFPTTTSGASSESHLEVENNGEGEVRWYLSSFAPPYVKGVDDSGDVYRATYTAFRCSRVSGTLEAHGKIKVAISFLPRGGGDYAQFWDLECHPITDAHMKHKIRFQLCGTGRKAGGVVDIKDSSSTLVRIEAAAKARKIPGSDASAVKASQDEGTQRGVFAPQDSYTFPYTRVGGSSTLKVNVRNNTFATHMLKFVSPKEPFHIKHSKYSLRTQHYINLPVQFRPDAAGKFEALLLIQTDAYGSLTIQLAGEAVE
ncbi:centrosomal protein of 192 kDa isoform X1 [Acipenser ruthenus]|uniref:centrosomal protein of 192 kDa isoform X1 n=1 Tax=Acipenser ruthenus TaxID=7906 RepID=UPI00274182D9|nr:centrosomal protein of 192 kDa isoform X1 [Acipenser ruthenus]XP_058878689.1 centrosomal protein of 192 kDa isoform X1 [Acipenser ruthenus]